MGGCQCGQGISARANRGMGGGCHEGEGGREGQVRPSLGCGSLECYAMELGLYPAGCRGQGGSGSEMDPKGEPLSCFLLSLLNGVTDVLQVDLSLRM